MCNLRWLEVIVQDKKTTTTTKIYTLYCHAVWMNLEVFDNLLYVFSYTSSMPMVKLHPHCPSNPTAQVCEYNLPVDKNIIGGLVLCCEYRQHFMESAGVWVVDVSEIEQVRDFWCKNNECLKIPYKLSTFHVVLCLFMYTYWDSHHFGSLFISNLSKMLKFAAIVKWQWNRSIRPISRNVC